MAHFACLDSDNIVQNIIFIENKTISDENGNESEEIGVNICSDLFPNENYTFKQTSYNSNFRNTYAKIGMKYDFDLDSFIDIQPFDSWTLDTQTKQWVPPVPVPELDEETQKTHTYIWDEENLEWILKTNIELGVIS
jgi:hypothetical protein